MVLILKNSNIFGVHWKIWLLEGDEKPIYRERLLKNHWLGQIIDLRKRGWYLWMWGRDTPMPTVIILPHLELSRIDLPKLMKWEIRSFLEPKGSLKDDIYWLLKRSCFELFGDGKYCLFSAKKLMERWYLHGLFELSMIFQDLGKTVFRAVIKKVCCVKILNLTILCKQFFACSV